MAPNCTYCGRSITKNARVDSDKRIVQCGRWSCNVKLELRAAARCSLSGLWGLIKLIRKWSR